MPTLVSPPVKSPRVSSRSPLPPRRILLAPGRYATVSGLKAGQAAPNTQLGRLAQQLVQQTSAATLSVAATSAYVYSLTQLSAPKLTFTSVPAGMKSDVAKLQSAYDSFLTQLATFQGIAGVWINTQQNSGAASIFSQLVSVPETLSSISGSVAANFTLLGTLPPTNPTYQDILTQQETLIGAESANITSLITQMTNLGSNLENTANTLIGDTDPTQVLGQLLAAYATDIATLQTAINNANSTISSDNDKIVGEGVGAAASCVVGVIGLANWWNPAGWIMMGAGAVGAYFAIEEIEALKAEIAALQQQISADVNWQDTDKAAAQLVSGFCTQLQGFAALNAAAQVELTTLENLYQTLSADIASALSDLQNNDLADAQTEWNTILAAGQFLQGLTAYVWPSPTMLSAPRPFAPIGNDLYSLSLSGEVFHYSASTNAWTDMQTTALSCAGAGNLLVTIAGAPISGTTVGSAPNSTYLVQSYNLTTQAWTTISTFPAATIATDGNNIYAINQTATDRQVYQYSGSGTVWTQLAALPGSDAAIQIAVAGGAVFALANNSQCVYQYNAANGGSWSQVGLNTAWGTIYGTRLVGNGTKLGIIATNGYLYLYDPTSGSGPIAITGSQMSVAQLSSGIQYAINVYQNLYYDSTPTSNPTWTYVASNATGVFASDTNVVYYGDNLGNLYVVSSSGAPTQLPAMPSS